MNRDYQINLNPYFDMSFDYIGSLKAKLTTKRRKHSL